METGALVQCDSQCQPGPSESASIGTRAGRWPHRHGLHRGIIRRPIPFSILNYVQTGFALLVIGYMLYVSFFDVQDLGGGDAGQQYEIVFEAPQASE